MGFVANMNEKFSSSRVGQYFKVKERGSSLTTEIVAGLTTFATLCYVLPVNSDILAATGGPCPGEFPAGTDYFADEDYLLCVQDVKKSLLTATAASSAISCFLMGMFANMPIQLAPAMGMNAYFAFTVVGVNGGSTVSYETALTAVFIEGWIFLALSITGLRQIMAVCFPHCIKEAITPGIGLFLTHIGLQTSEGIGLVVGDSATLVHLGGCPPDKRIYPIEFSSWYMCNGNVMTSARTWIGAIAFLCMALLLTKRIRTGMLLVIIVVSVMSWFRDTDFTQFPNDFLGDEKFDYFKKVRATSAAARILLMRLRMSSLVTFLYTDLLDATGTMQAVARQSGLTAPDGSYPGQKAAFCSDATGIIVGSMMGISPITAFAESSAGIEAGGRTGLVAIVGAMCFIIALFFAPILSNIPPWATGPALLITGALMMQAVTAIDWKDKKQAIPAFATIALMPLTYSIAYGIIGGLITAFFIYTGHYLWELAAGRMTIQEIITEIKTVPGQEDTTDDVAMQKSIEPAPVAGNGNGALA
ncbi:permease family-domain-containing protein [Tribonema minus]|uniref:Permease family-domain-containing protein n=1 Tax=Tribonema minus TaxID=303371 RepID=A0A835ZCW2_9STRA|nr:permease family-domain-containing protein [Tribonema minus]